MKGHILKFLGTSIDNRVTHTINLEKLYVGISKIFIIKLLLELSKDDGNKYYDISNIISNIELFIGEDNIKYIIKGAKTYEDLKDNKFRYYLDKFITDSLYYNNKIKNFINLDSNLDTMEYVYGCELTLIYHYKCIKCDTIVIQDVSEFGSTNPLVCPICNKNFIDSDRYNEIITKDSNKYNQLIKMYEYDNNYNNNKSFRNYVKLSRKLRSVLFHPIKYIGSKYDKKFK